MISNENRRARTPSMLGMIAVPKPLAVICMPIVLAANFAPTLVLVPDIKAGKMGAMEKPIKATAARLIKCDGFQTNNAVPDKAPTRLP